MAAEAERVGAKPHTKAQDGATVGDAQYLESWAIVDGFGRTITTLAEDAEVEIEGDQGTESAQRWIVGAMQEWDQKSAVRKKYLEFYFTGEPRDFDFGEVPLTYYGRQRYDAFGRQLQTFDLDGTVTLQSRYHALSSDAWDAADLEPGPHAGTPLSSFKDGHGRTLQVIERFHEGTALEERITETQYLPTGEPEVIRRRKGSTGQEVTRWFAYDTLGRMVLNVEPNTSAAYLLNPDPNLSEDQTQYDGIDAWRYRYNDAGDLVGTSDARGCGANFFYDGAGRLVGEDYFGCLGHHAEYTEPAGQTTADISGTLNFLPDHSGGNSTTLGDGLEVHYLYDAYVNPQSGSPSFGDCNPTASGMPEAWWRGRLVRVDDQAAQTYSRYDGRGRVTCVARRVAWPYEVDSNTQLPPFAERYTPRWYGMNYLYDAADRVVEETTGAEVLATGDESSVFTHYNTRGVVENVTSSYNQGGSDVLIGNINRTADNLVTLVQYGDLAQTATTYTYDDRRRVHTVLTARAPPIEWPTAPSTSTFQMVLQDEQYFYDVVNNPVEIRDNRIEEEWPAGAKPVSKKIQYDDLYRAKRIEYQYTAGDDAWVSPHAADVEGAGDTRRAQPSPHVSFAKRILWQTYQYDWLGNNVQTGDDANGFYDRSLGTIDNGTANDGPYQLRGADLGTDELNVAYDVTGNLETLFVERSGPCLPTGSSCSQSFIYRWDELGRLTHAKRWDGGTQVTDFGAAGADADLEYKYAAGDQRVLKTATDGGGAQVHSVYIYPSLELRRAEYDADSPGDYTRDGATEVAYLFANGVRLARLVNEPNASSSVPEVGGLHVFFELGDHLGSTSVALDKATSELVERATYQAYGGAESDYRPERWGSFREDYRFTGKEEDAEVGLTYFGKRFYNAALQRWASADPLEVHAPGEADANLYAYVSGMAFKNVDPLGLDPQSIYTDAISRHATFFHDRGFSSSQMYFLSTRVTYAGELPSLNSDGKPNTTLGQNETHWKQNYGQPKPTVENHKQFFQRGELGGDYSSTLVHELGHAFLNERLGEFNANREAWAPLMKAADNLILENGANGRSLSDSSKQTLVHEVVAHRFEQLITRTLAASEGLGISERIDEAVIQNYDNTYSQSARGYTGGSNQVAAGQHVPNAIEAEATSMVREFLQLNPDRGSAPITGQEILQHKQAVQASIEAPSD